jgi:hypothetical protein
MENALRDGFFESLHEVRARLPGEGRTAVAVPDFRPLSQVFLLGVIAQRLGGSLKFDPVAKRFTNNDRANQLLQGPPRRPGWERYYRV